jgi:hypothetical protein
MRIKNWFALERAAEYPPLQWGQKVISRRRCETRAADK